MLTEFQYTIIRYFNVPLNFMVNKCFNFFFVVIEKLNYFPNEIIFSAQPMSTFIK